MSKQTTATVDRLASKREDVMANREAVRRLKLLVQDIATDINLDTDRIANRLDSATRSEYGAVNGLINLVSALAAWPANQGDGSVVSANKLILEDKHKLDLLLLDDIRNFRGFHTFVTDDLNIIAGTEPDYENYADYCSIFLEELGVTSSKPTINQDRWLRLEEKAKTKAEEELSAMKEAMAKHAEFIAQQQ